MTIFLKLNTFSNLQLLKCIFISFFLSLTIIPFVIYICREKGWYDTVDARKVHTGSIPRLGSFGIIIGFFFALIIYIFLTKQSLLQYFIFIFCGIIIFIFGVIDDFKNLNANFKFIIQCFVGFVFVYGNFIYKNNQIITFSLFTKFIITFFWIVIIINAYNLIDGIDGLCGGLSALSILTYGIILFQKKDQYFTMCFILVSAILGFLIYNKPKAKIFMGDGGSQFLGYFIAALPLFNNKQEFDNKKILIVLNLVSIPLFDLIAAIWRRIREHRGIMSPDKLHLHHKLMNLGFKTEQVLGILLIIQLLICICVFLSTKVNYNISIVVLNLSFIFSIFFFCIIHFLNRRKMRNI